MECTICPTINIKNNDGAVCSVKYCVLQAALKHAQERHDICGKEVELKLEEPAAPEQVEDANEFTGIDPENVIEGEIVDEPREEV